MAKKGVEMVVEDEVSRFGLHCLHVVRAGSPVEKERYLARAGKVAEAIWEYEEKEIGMWHLRLWWKEGTAEGLPCPYEENGGGDERQ